MKTIYDLCQPREDVLMGRTKDEEFAADLSQVVIGTAVPEYADPATFFKYTYPTRGLKTLLETVCRRLSGKGGELNSVIRLDTQYGGGKTHGLIALVHAVRLKTIQQNLITLESKARSRRLQGEEPLSVTDVISVSGMQKGLRRYRSADDSKIIKSRTITLTEFGAGFVRACGGP